MERKTDGAGQPHPLPEPRWPGPLTADGLQALFADCADFRRRELWVGGDRRRTLTLCYVEGMVRNERVSDYILRPLAQDKGLLEGDMFRRMKNGALYNLYAQERTTLDQVMGDLAIGSCVIFFPGRREALTFFTGSEDRRAIGEPENEPAVKGARDSFTESLRANTALVRRRVRVPELRLRELVVGRQTLTPVDVLWLEGIADPGTVERVADRLGRMDIDGIRTAGSVEEYLADRLDTPFPLLASTQRPDWFCDGLLEGRVGILCEGQSVGWLAPGTLDRFFKTGQDKAGGWIAASAIRLLRWVCMLVSLLLPALYVAAVTFHPEMVPVPLALSIAAARQQVPFSSVVEVLILLAAFEVLQEAGLRLPGPMGQTVSILGGLVVGSAAVEARIVSPAVLIAVAIAGIAGYTVPSQDLANALRLWRFGLTILASLAGVVGLGLGVAALVRHLAGLESFGVPYLGPFVKGEGLGAVLRRPLPLDKWRQGVDPRRNRRNQR